MVGPAPRGRSRPGGVTGSRLIGVFTAQLEDAYQAALWRGIETRARSRGVGVICFLGSRIASPVTPEATANIAYRIAGRENVDGLIVISTAITTFLDAKGVKAFFGSRGRMPQVSVGLRVAGVPSLAVNGSDGVAAVVRHLVRDHGRSRFALIGGPPGHPEAEERRRSFFRVLAEEGVAFDERLAESGMFLRDSGVAAARQILARGLPFNALVCMNDRMALGALEVLRDAGIRVPGDVAIVGFDGIEESRYVTPPLTTVVQPIGELGALAVDALLRAMDGEKLEDFELSCRPVFRESCGCPPRRSYDPELEELPADSTAQERAEVEKLVELAGRGDGAGFIARLNTALSAAALAGSAAVRWHDYLSVVRRTVPPGDHAATLPPSIYEFARVLVTETETRLQAAWRLASEERLATLRTISASLAGAFELPVMLERLETGLARLGIGGGYLALFDGAADPAARSRLIMAPRGGAGPHPLPGRGVRFRTQRLLPGRAGVSWRTGQWILEPLVFQTEPLGYILLPGSAAEPAVYHTLQEQVSSALKGALLLDQVRTHEHRLENEVARRTAELTRANRELTAEIERRMRLEEEVLRISNLTMQRIGQDLHDDLCQHMAGIAMLTSVLRGSLAGMEPAVSTVDRIASLLADSIARAKQIARGLYPAGLTEHGLVAAVEELVETARRTHPVSVEFRASPDFSVPDTDRALHVYRIVQEALTNALRHSGSERIEVRLVRAEGRRRESTDGRLELVAEVVDYGTGLPVKPSGDGMGLRIMRYRAEMAGAELRIERLEPGTRVSCRLRI